MWKIRRVLTMSNSLHRVRVNRDATIAISIFLTDHIRWFWTYLYETNSFRMIILRSQTTLFEVEAIYAILRGRMPAKLDNDYKGVSQQNPDAFRPS